MSLRVGIPSIGMRGNLSQYEQYRNAAISAARNNNASLWYAGAAADLSGFVFQDSTGTIPASSGGGVGANLLSAANQNFSAGNTWTAQPTGFSIVTGNPGYAQATAAAGYIYINQAIISGLTYRVTYTVSDYVSGFIAAGFGLGTQYLTDRTSNGTFTETVVCSVASQTIFGFFNTGPAFTGKISNVSVQIVSGGDPVGLLLDRSRVAGESYGAELGAFPTGWSAYSDVNLSVPTGGVSVVGNQVTITRSGAGDVFYSKAITGLVVGNVYRLKFQVISGTASYSTIFGKPLVGSATVSAGTTVTFLITANATTYYPTIWPFNPSTAITITAPEIQEAVGTLGPELVSNGNFSNGTTGWFPAAGPASIAVVAGELVVTGNATDYAQAQQAITGLTVGNYYKLTGSLRRGTTASQVFFSAKSGVNVVSSATTATQVSLVWQADATSTTIGAGIFAVAAAGTAIFDDISFRQLLGYPALQATSGNRPTLELQANGYYGVKGDSNDFLNVASLTAGMTTAFTVITSAIFNSAGNQVLFDGNNAAGSAQLYNSPGNTVVAGKTGIGSYLTPTVTGGSHVVTNQVSSGTGSLLVDGVSAASGAVSGIAAISAFTILGQSGGFAGFARSVFLICVCNTSAMPSADRIAIERFAALLSGATYS